MSGSERQLISTENQFGLLDASINAPRFRHPLVIGNDGESTMLWAIRHELQRSDEFCFSVAFVTTGAVALLKQALLDFQGSGTIITSTYLGFNEPDALRELLKLDRVSVFLHPSEDGRGFHAKGYVFRKGPITTAIVGSSNLTSHALTKNEELNLRVSTLDEGDLDLQISEAIERQLRRAIPLTEEWISEYESTYPERVMPRDVEVPLQPSWSPPGGTFVPNKMQVEALDAIAAVRDAGEKRAVVVSATGTGKTVLAALDVQAVDPDRMLFVVHREQILDAAIEEFQQVLGAEPEEFGKFVGQERDLDRRYVFATIQSISKPENLHVFDPKYFDYVLIDEVHRAGADSYLRLINYLKPKFLLGLTATPERTDNFSIYELFDFNVPYEIRLQAALDADMLAPFHYYGVTDYVTESGEVIDETSNLSRLVEDERVDHLCRALERYGHVGKVRGLIFCSRREEAIRLSSMLNEREVNGRRLKTLTLTGTDSVAAREDAVERLERDELDYLITVDVFNEGIDIPTVNQVVMVRETQSSIVFTQQLGRGLRKAKRKDHLRVIDFIGNYTNNFLIPIALLGDSSLNKDIIRQKLIQVDEAGSISGLSSINFDKISRQRVLQSISEAPLDSMPSLKAAFLELEQRIGQPPMLMDFVRFDKVDPVVIANKCGHYWRFLNRVKREDEEPTESMSRILNFLTLEFLNGKRPHELLLLRWLLNGESITEARFAQLLEREGCSSSPEVIRSVKRIFNLEFFTQAERKRYGDTPILKWGNQISLSDEFVNALQESEIFGDHVDDAIEAGLYLSRHRYPWMGALDVGNRYSRKDVCRVLNWSNNEQGTIFGYKVDRETSTCPIFITYHKSENVTESTRYEDEFKDTHEILWFTRSRRTLESDEVKAIIDGGVDLHVFAKKDDAEGVEFTYLGIAEPSDPVQTTMPGNGGEMLDVVTMTLKLETPMEEGVFRYFVAGE